MTFNEFFLESEMQDSGFRIAITNSILLLFLDIADKQERGITIEHGISKISMHEHKVIPRL